MTAVTCPHCERMCGGPAGLSAHVRSMHPAEWRASHEPGAPIPNIGGGSADTNGIVWEDPPSKNGKNRDRVLAVLERLEELRPHPRRWARLYTWRSKSAASTVKNGLNKEPAAAGFEFTARCLPDGTSAIYGRYID